MCSNDIIQQLPVTSGSGKFPLRSDDLRLFPRSASACLAMARCIFSGKARVLDLHDGYDHSPWLRSLIRTTRISLLMASRSEEFHRAGNARRYSNRSLGDLIDGTWTFSSLRCSSPHHDLIIRDSRDVHRDIILVVMIFCGGTGKVIVRISTLTTRSIPNGTTIFQVHVFVPTNFPKRNTTPTSYCCTIRKPESTTISATTMISMGFS